MKMSSGKKGGWVVGRAMGESLADGPARDFWCCRPLTCLIAESLMLKQNDMFVPPASAS